MKIIDSHAHLGDCRMSELDYSENDIINAMGKNNIDKIILQNFPYVRDNLKGHERIAKLTKEHQNKIFGIISVNPHCDDKDYFDYIKRIIKMGGFVGIKLHTFGYCISPISSDSEKVYKIALEYDIPVMVHTGLINFGEPSLVIIPAKKYPKINFVLAHSGWSSHAAQAMVAALTCDNIYLETSWTSIDDKKLIISKLSSEKVMLGSDTISNMNVEITQYKDLNIPDKDLENVFYKVAEKVFKI
jgi:uncharacterized protein